MERVPKSISWAVPKVLLHQEDLADLIDIFQRYGKGCDFEIGGYRLTDASELPAVPLETTSELSFTSKDPYVSVTLTRTHGRVYASASSGVLGRGMADELRERLLRSQDRCVTLPASANRSAC